MKLLFCLTVFLAARQEPGDALRQEFDRLARSTGFSSLTELGPLLFSQQEKDFILGAARLREMRHNPSHAAPLRKAALISFRRARAMGWIRGQEAADTLLLTYAPNAREKPQEFLQAVKDALKGADDPPARQTLRLVAVLDGEEDRELIRQFAADPGVERRGFALHVLIRTRDPQDNELIAAFLKDSDSQIRRSAAVSLSRLHRHAPEQAEAVAELLGDDYCVDVALGAIRNWKLHRYAKRIVPLLGAQETRRYLAYVTLRELDGSQVVDDVTRFLDHKDANVRLCAVRLLGRWRVQARESVLGLSLKDDDAQVREAAVEALVDLPATVSIEGLIQRLDDLVPEVRSRAAVALGVLNVRRVADRIADLGKSGMLNPGAAAEALLRMTPPARTDAILDILDPLAREPFRMQMGDCVPDERRKCLGFLELLPIACERDADACVAGLVQRSKDYPAEKRIRIFHSIAARGSLTLVKTLDAKGLLTDPEAKSAALNVYGRTITADEVPNFVKLVRRLDPQQKQHLWPAGASFVDEYAAFADDPDPAVRRLVVHVLSRDAKLRHFARLQKFAEDEDPAVRIEVARYASYVASTEHHGTVEKLLKDRDPNVVSAALQAVGQLRLTRLIPEIVALTKNEKHGMSARFTLVRLGAKEHSAEIVPMLSDPESAPYAAQLLGELGARERLPDLLRVADQGKPMTRAKAIEAAALLGGPIPKLADLMADPEDWVRAAAATAAGTLRERNAIESLAKLLKDPSNRVKAAAIKALADLDARDYLPAFLEILELGRLAEDETIRAQFFGDDGPIVAVQAAADALGRLGTADTTRIVARHWRRARGTSFGGILEPALLRLDARKFLEPILAGYGEDYGTPLVQLMNQVGAPDLFESIKARQLTRYWNHEYGTLDRFAARVSEAFGIKVRVSPSVPDDVKNRPCHISGFPKDWKAGDLSIMNNWHECVGVYVESSGEVVIMSLGEAKRYWLEWARAK